MDEDIEIDLQNLNITSSPVITNANGNESDAFALFVLFFLVFSQIGILAWKKFKPKSFQTVTLIGLWLIPPIISLIIKTYTYFSICVIFTIINLYIFKRSQEKPLHPKTPKMIYGWFTIIHKTTYFIGVCGYVMILLSLFLEGQVILLELGLYVAFYGLYFGILNKDIVEELSSRMSLNIGYIQKSGIPTKNLNENVCAICGGTVDSTENSCKLDCNHVYHILCIKGWIIIGKKTTCPYCKEKVDTKKLSENPWQTTQILYINMLDFFRYLLVWQPFLILVIQIIARITKND